MSHLEAEQRYLAGLREAEAALNSKPTPADLRAEAMDCLGRLREIADGLGVSDAVKTIDTVRVALDGSSSTSGSK